MRLIGCIWTAHTSPRLSGGRLRAEGECTSRRKSRWTSAGKVTGKVALSKHSCRTCVHRCVFVYTHTPPVCCSTVPTGLINPERALQRAGVSQHTLFLKSPRPSLKTRTYSAFLLCSAATYWFSVQTAFLYPVHADQNCTEWSRRSLL